MMDQTLDELRATVTDQLLAGADPARKMEVNEYLQECRAPLAAVGDGDAFETFLTTHLNRQYDRYQATGDGDRVAEPRDRPLCTCENAFCPLKEGRVPEAVRAAPDLERGIRSYAQDHTGDPLVLTEAREAYADHQGRLYGALVVASVALRQDRPLEELDPPEPPTGLTAR